MLSTYLAEQEIAYTGEQLRSHWAYRTLGLEGDSIVAFLGRCQVVGDRLVDMEDARAGDKIVAREMLHFIAEHFDSGLEKAVLRQRLLAAIVAEVLGGRKVKELSRRGDDVYCRGRKLTVSVATVSPVSTLIHVGVNVDPEGAPVPAIGLKELGVEAKPLAEEVMEAYRAEMESVQAARRKVRGVR